MSAQQEPTGAVEVAVAVATGAAAAAAEAERVEVGAKQAADGYLRVPAKALAPKRRQSTGGEPQPPPEGPEDAEGGAGRQARSVSATNEDARSITTTTSDVNSADDAASIVHRLSQIVVEQECKLGFEVAQRRCSMQAEPPRPMLEGEGQLEQQQRTRRFSLKPSRSSPYESDEQFLLKSLDDEPSDRASDGPQREEQGAGSQTPSPPTPPPPAPPLAPAPPPPPPPSATTTTTSSGIHTPVIQRNSSSNFLPERGDLRALEINRKQQHQQAAAAVAVQKASLEPPSAVRLRALSFDGPAMLNIRRSTWTLSEFDQTFNKSSANVSNSSIADSLTPVTSATSTANLATVAIINNKDQQLSPTHLHTGSEPPLAAVATGGDKLASSSSNLMIMASKNNAALSHSIQPSLSMNGLHLVPQHHASGVVQSSILQAANLCTSKPGALLVPNSGFESEARRRYSAISFASSQDSFNSPFNKARSKSFVQTNRRDGEQEDEANMSACRRCCRLQVLSRYLPALDWLPNYKRSQLSGDIMAGLVVATLNISISLSAAVVAETDPGTAFRASIVSTFVYSILCSSRHTSFGSWSIMSQMMVVSVKRALSDELLLSRLNIGSSLTWSPEDYERWHLNIIIMYTFLIGFVQLMGGLLNLGNILASFIPEALGSGMIAATAFTMAIGQLANMCGTTNKVLWSIERNTTALWADLKNPPVDITDLFAGLFRWIKQIALLIKYYEQINTVCVTISVVSVILLFCNQCFIQKWLESYFKRKIFIPFEVILVVVMIIISYSLELRTNYNVTTCGPIVIEFAAPNVPNLKLIRELWFESLATALISYSMVYVMSKQYSNKLNYEVEYNQELIACGAGNLIGGLFDALPATASFSRTSAKVEAGGNTQMASLINCVVLLILAHFLGQYVTELPVCVTSAALFYGFVRMMTSFTKVFVYWRVCKVDFAIWSFTFMAILTLDLVNGFVYGFIFSIFTMLYRAQSRRCYMLGSIGSSDVYVPLDKYPLAEEVDGINIFQFCGPIHYVCADIFERLLRQKTRVNVKQIANYIAKQKEEDNFKFDPRDMNLPTHIILDFSMISFVDTAGINIIKKIIEDYDKVNVTILIASLASHVAAMVKSEPTLWGAYKERFYVTLNDAVHCAIRDRRLREATEMALAEQNVNISVT